MRIKLVTAFGKERVIEGEVAERGNILLEEVGVITYQNSTYRFQIFDGSCAVFVETPAIILLKEEFRK